MSEYVSEKESLLRRSPNKIIDAKNISKKFRVGQAEVIALQKINLSLNLGDSLAVVGPSGSGKSTLLHILGGLDIPDSGEVFIDGQIVNNESDHLRTSIRNKKIGFIYQFHHLLPEFSAVENVAMPLIIRRVSYPKACKSAKFILSQIGLEKRLNHYPSMLSGGERQRVAIARALITDPCLVLADEPTGNLDTDNAIEVFNILVQRVNLTNAALIVVTHDLKLARKCKNVISLG